MASGLYNQALKEIQDGTIDLLTATLKVMLVTSSYTFNPDNQFVDEAGANDPIDHELTGTGYVAGFGNSGRKTLASKAVNKDDTNNRAEFDAANLTWTGIDAGICAAAIVIIEGTSDTDSKLIAYLDNATELPVTTNGGDFTLNWSAEGLWALNAQ